jgi:VanZ family protein
VRRLRAWLPAIAWSVAIYALSARSSIPVDLAAGLDKVAHFGAYAVLGVLLAHGQRESAIAPSWALALGLAYAATDEWHQSFVPGRSADPADWVADALGVAAGLFF